MLRDLARFELVNLSTLSFNFAALPLLVEVFGWPVLLSQLVITGGNRRVHLVCSPRILLPPQPGGTRRGRAAASLIVTPRVSVVVPAYNSVAFIDATMRSILEQTFTDFELMVSDHSSTDGTWEALQPYAADPRVRLSRLPPGGGGPANFNAVTDLATGEFVKLVCGDDLLSPDSLAEQVAALASSPVGGDGRQSPGRHRRRGNARAA